MNGIDEVYEFLKQNPIQIFSTCVDSIPFSRPIGSAMLFDNRIHYCMNKDKNMYLQLKQNPNVCVCVCAKDYSWIRIFAKVVFSEDIDVKLAYIKQGKTRFKDANAENFIVFYLEELTIEIRKNGILNEIKI